jgi:lipid-A-disaccharide synthase
LDVRSFNFQLSIFNLQPRKEVKPKQIMIIAGEASGDVLAAELVGALRRELAAVESAYSSDLQPLRTGLEPRFFGAGGPCMKDAGVELAFDLTEHSVIGLSGVAKHYFKFRGFFNRLCRLALEREPDVIVCVDFSGFNRRFAHAIKQYARRRHDWFHDWQPRTVQYVSPQVWASRESRAYQIARDYDLLLSIFPFEKDWYAKRVPKLKVEFVGHPTVDRYQRAGGGRRRTEELPAAPLVLLLPGSRPSELKHHLPVMLGALELMRASSPQLRARMVLPNPSLAQRAKSSKMPPDLEIQVGGLSEALEQADIALASTGTVTMECAWFGVPAVTLYKAWWVEYQIARQIVKVKSLTMPNLLANAEVFPEFIQNAATPESLSCAALGLLRDQDHRRRVRMDLARIVASLGGPGAVQRAARAIVRMLDQPA